MHLPAIPAEQAGTEDAHAPMPQVITPRPSSMAPSQSSSLKLQTSAWDAHGLIEPGKEAPDVCTDGRCAVTTCVRPADFRAEGRPRSADRVPSW
jgi:hypothetical protein